MAKRIQVGGRIESKEVGGIVTGAAEILDDAKEKKQSVINQETDDELARLDQSKQDNLTFDNAPTEGSDNPVKSGGIYTAQQAILLAIAAINELIPSAASALNKLADKAFVNSSISTNTATFRGTSAAGLNEQQFLAWANGLEHDLNDYVFWQTSDAAGNTLFKRYKWNGTEWRYEYTLNNSTFTAEQWEAIQSGITALLVAKLRALPTAQELIQSFDSKQDVLTFDDVPTLGSTNPVKSSGIYNVIKAITDLIPAEATEHNQLADKADVAAKIVAAIPSWKGQYDALTDLQAVTGSKAGDMGCVKTTDSDGHAVLTFYQYSAQGAWVVYYTLRQYAQNKPATTGTTGDYPYNGMGRIELQKNIVNGVNTLTQAMLTQQNTIYIIQYDFTLGEDITVPANCMLEFDGGSISKNGTNDTIAFTNTMLKGCVKCYATCTGTLSNDEIEIDWFISDNNPTTFLINLNNLSGFSVVNFTRGKDYLIDAIGMRYNYGIQTSNVEFRGNGCRLKPVDTDYMSTSIFGLQNCTNVYVHDFTIQDIVDLTTMAVGNRHGMNIVGCTNITVERIKFYNVAADGIRMDNNDSINVNDITVDHFGRNGISVISGSNIIIKYSVFSNPVVSANIPNEAHECIDIEPNGSGVYLRNIHVDGNKFYDAPVGIYLHGDILDEMEVEIANNIFTNAFFTETWGEYSNTKGTVVFRDNIMQDLNNGAISLKTASATNIYTYLKNNILHNVNVLNGSLVDTRNAILIHDRGSDTIQTNIGNVVVDGLNIKQDSTYSTYMKGIVIGYPYTGKQVENVKVRNVFVEGAVFSFSTYELMYGGLPKGSLEASAGIPVTITGSVAQALQPSNKYIVTQSIQVGLRDSIGLDFDEVEIIAESSMYLTSIFTSGLTIKFDGGTYETGDVIRAKAIKISKCSSGYYLTINNGSIWRNNKIIYQNPNFGAFANGNIPDYYNGDYMQGSLIFNKTTHKMMFCDTDGTFKNINS